MSEKFEQFVQFKKEGLLINEQANTVYQSNDMELVDALGEKISFKFLRELEKDYAFFTLGHVYIGAEVPYSFIEQFSAEHGEHYFVTVEAPDEFMTNLSTSEGTWGNVLHGIQRDAFSLFTDYMTKQYLSRKEKELMMGVKYDDMVIEDPVFKTSLGYNPLRDCIEVRIFTPRSQKATIHPYLLGDKVGIYTEPTPPEVARDLMAIKMIYQHGEE